MTTTRVRPSKSKMELEMREGCLLIQGSGGLVHPKARGCAAANTGRWTPAGAGPPESPRAVLARRGSPRPFSWMMGGKARKLLGPLDLLGRKVPEHGDVVPQGAVEHEHVLLHQGDPARRGTWVLTVESSPAVVEDFPRVAAVARHEQIQQGGLPPSRKRPPRRSFSPPGTGRLRGGAPPPPLGREKERSRTWMPLFQLFGDGRALSSRTFWARESASLSIRAKADRRLASISGPSCRNMMESPAELEEHRGHARGDAIALQGQGGRHQEHPELGCHPPATLPKERSTWARHIRRRLASWAWALLWENSRKMSFSALKLFTTEKPVRPSLTMERKLSFFRETSCSRLAKCLPATREAPKGSRESTRAIKVSRGAVPEHHQKGAHAEDGVHHQVKELFQVVHLDAVGVVGEGGQIGGGALPGKRWRCSSLTAGCRRSPYTGP